MYQNGVEAGTFDVLFRLVGVESITVPAGTFPGCLKLESTFTLMGTREDHYEWWAPGVGMVRRLILPPSPNPEDQQLVSAAVIGVNYP